MRPMNHESPASMGQEGLKFSQPRGNRVEFDERRPRIVGGETLEEDDEEPKHPFLIFQDWRGKEMRSCPDDSDESAAAIAEIRGGANTRRNGPCRQRSGSPAKTI